MQFRVLGAIEVCRGARTIPLRGRRQRTLLAALLVHAGSVVPVDTLAEALWPDEPPSDPRNAVQTAVARLRAALGPQAPISTRSPGYLLEVEQGEIDAGRFEQLLAEAQRRSSEPAAARELLEEALGLWRGPPYAEFADDIAHGEALRLAEQRRRAEEEHVAARLTLGEAAALVGELEAALAAEPLRERLVDLLMQALAALDRQGEALAVYRGYREQLADETGLEPSPALTELERRVLHGELASPPSPRGPASPSTPGEPVAAAETPGVGPAPATPPEMATSLVGRERELTDLGQVLARARLVTLTGPGGVGKTRIAAAAADRVAQQGSEVAWIELAPVGDPAAVDHVVAAALGVDIAGADPPRSALINALAARRLVLVLDNCEHLRASVGLLVEQLARRCAGLRVLATSRERLAVDGEWVQPVAPLPVHRPEHGVETAVTLFLERAAAAGARLDLPAQLPAVEAICEHVDGLPLAIELAAARAGVLTVEHIRAALQADAAAAGHRRGAARHRDLWAVADWSYRLLEPAEQQLFERLSVFAGAFAAEDAHAICADADRAPAATLARLAVLAEQSLITPADQQHGRYRLLRPLRAFARQRLADRGEAGSVADRHARVLTDQTVRAAGPPLRDEGRQWLDRALDDLRAARSRAQRTGDVALLGRLIAALYRYDYWRPGAELTGWADEARTLEAMEREPTAPQVAAAAAAAAWRRGDLPRARELAAHGLALGAGSEDPALAIVYEAAGDVATFEGRLADAEAAFREEARLARAGGDPDSEVIALTSAALVAAYAGRIDEAVAEADAAADIAGAAGPAAQAFARYTQGECRADAAPREAIALVDEAVALAADCGAPFVEGVARLTAASLRGRHGDPREAVALFAEVIERWRRSGNWTQQWTTLRNLAELLFRLGADEPALVIAAAAEAEQSAAAIMGAESERMRAALAQARRRLGQERFEAARARGQRMGSDDVVDLALSVVTEHGAKGCDR